LKTRLAGCGNYIAAAVDFAGSFFSRELIIAPVGRVSGKKEAGGHVSAGFWMTL
jgi:hypothetical protein